MLSIVWKHFKKVGTKQCVIVGKRLVLAKWNYNWLPGSLEYRRTQEAMRRKEGGPIATKKAKWNPLLRCSVRTIPSRKASS
uniref:Uncharacterized protein n=1 Tax=Ditylenchus dipsaci TaxID=166011 RepID=A0A915D3P2_9BILA